MPGLISPLGLDRHSDMLRQPHTFPEVSAVHAMLIREPVVETPKNPVKNASYETECREALRPHFEALLDLAVKAGWDRNIASYSLMYLAAKTSRQPKKAQPDPAKQRFRQSCGTHGTSAASNGYVRGGGCRVLPDAIEYPLPPSHFHV